IGRIVAVPIIGNALRFVFFLATGGRSSNGRTPDSGSGYLGSNPSLPANFPTLTAPLLNRELECAPREPPAFLQKTEQRFPSPRGPNSLRKPAYSCGTNRTVSRPGSRLASKKSPQAPTSFR